MKFNINDDVLTNCKIIAYGCNCVLANDRGEKVPYNQKRFPNRAINIHFPIEDKQLLVEVFFNPKICCWDSKYTCEGGNYKLTPQQYSQFFKTNFYKKLQDKLRNIWALTSPVYKTMYQAILDKKCVEDIGKKGVDIENIYNDVVEEDIVLDNDVDECDGGGMSVGGEIASSGISSSDVLGDVDINSGDGYMGVNNYLPKNILKKSKMLRREIPSKKKKGHKNPYLKGSKIIADSEN